MYEMTFIGRHYLLTCQGREKKGDSGMVFSWQNASIVPGQSTRLSVIFKSGPFVATEPVSNLSETVFPNSVLHSDSLNVIGVVFTTYFSLSIRLFVVVDDDCDQIYFLSTELASNSSFSEAFHLVDCLLHTGLHTFSFYAYDDSGSISSAWFFSASVIAPTPYPSPLPGCGPIAISATFSRSGLKIFLNYEGDSVDTSFSSYSGRIRVGRFDPHRQFSTFYPFKYCC
jgi:hypothetical protein